MREVHPVPISTRYSLQVQEPFFLFDLSVSSDLLTCPFKLSLEFANRKISVRLGRVHIGNYSYGSTIAESLLRTCRSDRKRIKNDDKQHFGA